MPFSAASIQDVEPDATFDYKPFYIEPIVAWRLWKVEFNERRGVLLRSITYPIPWLRKKPVRAHCFTSWRRGTRSTWSGEGKGHSAPDAGHRCGFYSVKTPQDAIAWTSHSSATYFKVIGTVKIWGQIFQYEKGYLSEYAYPDEIVVPARGQEENKSGAQDAFYYPEELEAEEIAYLLEEAYGVHTQVGWPE